MDWIAIGTVSLVVVTVLLAILQRIRDGDVDMLIQLDKKVEHLHEDVHSKLNKEEHQVVVARIDKDIDQIKQEQNNRFDRFECKLDKLHDLIVEIIKK